MASPVISVLSFSVARGEEFVLTATQLSATDADSDLSYFKVTSQPTRGYIYYNGRKVVSTTQIPVAAIAAGLVSYRHDGSANNDSVTFKAVDAAAAESVDGVIAITAGVNANAPFMLFLVPTNGAPIAPFYGIRKWEAEDIADTWLATHGGASYVIGFGALDVTPPFTADSLSFVRFALHDPEGLKNPDTVEIVQERLTDLFLTGNYNAVKTLVNTHGAAMLVPGAVTMTADEQTEWLNVKAYVDVAPPNRRIVESSDLGHALAALKGTLV